MQLFDSIDTLRSTIFEKKLQRKSVGLVPTMGALHEGHMSLVHSAQSCDLIVVSVFVNPLQFNNASDLANYPRVLEHDLEKLEGKCDMVFAPDHWGIYAETPTTKIDFGLKSEYLEGKFRPGHFGGVGLIVSKLFNIVQPDRAYFGLKDLQQYVLIEQMVRDLSFPVEIVGCPTIREKSGLAMSSRNQQLSDDGKFKASKLFEGLSSLKNQLDEGIPLKQSKRQVQAFYESEGLDVEYLEYVSSNLDVLEEFPDTGNVIVCVAAVVERVRLIDNLYLRG